MAQYRKKPLVIEAFHLPSDEGDDWMPFQRWCKEHGLDCDNAYDDEIILVTLKGPMYAKPGDWIIKGVAGEFYPCKDEIFKATYEGAGVPSMEQVALRRLKELCESTVNTLRANLVPDGVSDLHTLAKLIGLFDGDDYRRTEDALMRATTKADGNGKETN